MSHTSPSPLRVRKKESDRMGTATQSEEREATTTTYCARDLSMTCSQCRTAHTSEPWYRARRLIFAGALAKEKKDLKASWGGWGMDVFRSHTCCVLSTRGREKGRAKEDERSLHILPPLRSSPSILGGRRMRPATLPSPSLLRLQPPALSPPPS